MSQSHYSYVAVRSQLRRFGILTGDRNHGFHCEICDKDIGSTNHFFWLHHDYFQMARESIDNRNFNIQIEA